MLRGTGITGISLRWTRATCIFAFHDVGAYESPFLGADRGIGDELEMHADQVWLLLLGLFIVPL
jgi:hypothetical protein